jgi:YfiH family protein
MKTECPFLSEFPSLKHAFFNSCWTENITEFTQDTSPLVTLTQVHSTRVVSITDPCKNYPKGDALVTNLKGVPLGVFTADCGPILFHDPKAHIIGACHAGWKGAKAGIVSETIKAMVALGSNRAHIYATLGPTIQHHHYEVGPEFPDVIGEPYNLYFYPSPRPDHHFFNLPLYIEDLLSKEGLSHVHNLHINTFDKDFESRRRSLELRETIFKDNLSVIAMY